MVVAADVAGPELALLPDAPMGGPSAVMAVSIPVPVDPCAEGVNEAQNTDADADAMEPAPSPCLKRESPYMPFLNSTAPSPLTPGQKAILAVQNFKDPGNLASIVYMSALTIGTDAHTAYGPGWRGFGENAGYRTLRSATAETVSTFLIPSIMHQDPRYHRMPNASVPRRILHAVSHTVVAEGDHGGAMPNYGLLVGTPIRAEIANLYVPGVNCNLPGTARRVANSYAMNPVNDLIAEFLPDLARHVHIRARFVARIVDNISGDK